MAEAPLATSPIGPEYPPDIQLDRRQPISRLGVNAGTALDWLMSGAAMTSAGPTELLDGVIARLVAAATR